jgi:6-pyruvoyltetrahydropterin/6-carboxytetrahydropterin synthase
MYTITKQFHFSASHRLRNLPEDHPCSRQHGHNYIVEVVLRGETVTETEQWVRDYGDLKMIEKYIDKYLDHRDLNEHFANVYTTTDVETTAEMLAWHMYKVFKGDYPELYAIRVSETPKTWAQYND